MSFKHKKSEDTPSNLCSKHTLKSINKIYICFLQISQFTEKAILVDKSINKKFVYFRTLSVNDSSSKFCMSAIRVFNRIVRQRDSVWRQERAHEWTCVSGRKIHDNVYNYHKTGYFERAQMQSDALTNR